MTKTKKTLLIIGIILTLSILSVLLLPKEKNLINLNYTEILEKIENKEDFVLCVSASECIHCKEYKPKLKKVAKEYEITIYYTNTDSFTDEEYKQFKKDFSFDGGTPTTIFFKNGEEKTTASRINGNVKIEKIISKFKNNGFISE